MGKTRTNFLKLTITTTTTTATITAMTKDVVTLRETSRRRILRSSVNARSPSWNQDSPDGGRKRLHRQQNQSRRRKRKKLRKKKREERIQLKCRGANHIIGGPCVCESET